MGDNIFEGVNAPSTVPSSSPLPSLTPSTSPSLRPSTSTLPSFEPSTSPSFRPSTSTLPSSEPSALPSLKPSTSPSLQPSSTPSSSPSLLPSTSPSLTPSSEPSTSHSSTPSTSPSALPSLEPSTSPSTSPSLRPSSSPSLRPSTSPSLRPSTSPSRAPSYNPSSYPSTSPSTSPTTSFSPSTSPSSSPSISSAPSKSSQPSKVPTTFQLVKNDDNTSTNSRPIWPFILGGVAILITILGILIYNFRKRRTFQSLSNKRRGSNASSFSNGGGDLVSNPASSTFNQYEGLDAGETENMNKYQDFVDSEDYDDEDDDGNDTFGEMSSSLNGGGGRPKFDKYGFSARSMGPGDGVGGSESQDQSIEEEVSNIPPMSTFDKFMAQSKKSLDDGGGDAVGGVDLGGEHIDSLRSSAFTRSLIVADLLDDDGTTTLGEQSIGTTVTGGDASKISVHTAKSGGDVSSTGVVSAVSGGGGGDNLLIMGGGGGGVDPSSSASVHSNGMGAFHTLGSTDMENHLSMHEDHSESDDSDSNSEEEDSESEESESESEEEDEENQSHSDSESSGSEESDSEESESDSDNDDDDNESGRRSERRSPPKYDAPPDFGGHDSNASYTENLEDYGLFINPPS